MDQRVERKAKLSSVRLLRNITLTMLPFIGVLLVIGAVLWLRDLRWQMVLVVGGLLLVEIGVWTCAQSILPNERKFRALRVEVDAFIRLVRQLNTAAMAVKENPSPEHQETFEDVREAMRQAVERMADVAGKTDVEATEGRANTVTR
jgi:hypothetical protein